MSPRIHILTTSINGSWWLRNDVNGDFGVTVAPSTKCKHADRWCDWWLVWQFHPIFNSVQVMRTSSFCHLTRVGPWWWWTEQIMRRCRCWMRRKKYPTPSLERRMNAQLMTLNRLGLLPNELYIQLRSSASRVPKTQYHWSHRRDYCTPYLVMNAPRCTWADWPNTRHRFVEHRRAVM